MGVLRRQQLAIGVEDIGQRADTALKGCLGEIARPRQGGYFAFQFLHMRLELHQGGEGILHVFRGVQDRLPVLGKGLGLGSLGGGNLGIDLAEVEQPPA